MDFTVPQRSFPVLKELRLEHSLGGGIILTLAGIFKGPASQALMRCDCSHPERL